MSPSAYYRMFELETAHVILEQHGASAKVLFQSGDRCDGSDSQVTYAVRPQPTFPIGPKLALLPTQIYTLVRQNHTLLPMPEKDRRRTVCHPQLILQVLVVPLKRFGGQTETNRDSSHGLRLEFAALDLEGFRPGS